MRKRAQRIFIGLCVLFVSSSIAGAADMWVQSTNAAVVTNNDCGHVSDVAGAVLIKRPFHGKDDPGVQANRADRLSSGDEIIVPDGARLEIKSGNNRVLSLGPGSRLRLSGMRSFTGPDGVPVSRLDIVLLTGELRVQVRRNENTPEAVHTELNGAEVILARGDAALHSGTGWRAAILSGDALVRVRRGGVVGTPFAVAGGNVVGPGNVGRLDVAEVAEIRRRTPFSHEMVAAALPPLPPMSTFLEAP